MNIKRKYIEEGKYCWEWSEYIELLTWKYWEISHKHYQNKEDAVCWQYNAWILGKRIWALRCTSWLYNLIIQRGFLFFWVIKKTFTENCFCHWYLCNVSFHYWRFCSSQFFEFRKRNEIATKDFDVYVINVGHNLIIAQFFVSCSIVLLVIGLETILELYDLLRNVSLTIFLLNPTELIYGNLLIKRLCRSV